MTRQNTIAESRKELDAALDGVDFLSIKNKV